MNYAGERYALSAAAVSTAAPPARSALLRRQRLRRSTRPRNTARATAAAAPQRIAPGARARRCRAVIPRALPRRLLRPPAGHRHRRVAPDRSRVVRRYVARARREPRRRPRPVVHGRRRHRQDDAGDARLQGGARGRPLGRDLLAAAAAHRDPRDVRRRAPAPTSDFLDAPHRRRPAAHRRPRRREDQHRLGARAALLDRQRRATRTSARSSSRPTSTATSWPSRSASAPSRGWSRCATTDPLFGRDDRRVETSSPPRGREPSGHGPTARLAQAAAYTRPVMPGIVDRGRPVGRRGQGQDHRPARRAGRRGRALPGRQQRRPHDRPRRARRGSCT